MKENIHKSYIKGLLMRINEGLQVNNQKKKKSSLKKMGQVIDISPKEIYRWLIRTSKDAQRH